MYGINHTLILFLITLCPINYCYGDSYQSEIAADVRLRLDELTQKVLSDETTLWHSPKFTSGGYNREELKITNVRLDESFKFGTRVKSWQEIRIGKLYHAVGLAETAIQLHTFDASGRFVKNIILELAKTPTSLSVTKQWNNFTRKMEGVVVCTTYDRMSNNNYAIDWYRITDDSYLQLKNGSWDVNKAVESVQIFSVDERQFALILNKQPVNSMDIYEFSYKDHSDFWLVNHHPLKYESNQAILTMSGATTFISIPDYSQQTIYVYKFTAPYLTHFQSIPIPKLQTLATFKINYHNYLIAGGTDTRIFRFTGRKLKREPVHDTSFGLVRHILPVKVKSFRDEVILLVDHEIEHGTHRSVQIVVFFYHDGVFQVHEEMPCDYYGQLRHGLSCMVEEETDYGLHGGVSLTFAALNETRLLLPRIKSHAELFIVDTVLEPVANPFVAEIKHFAEMRTKILDLYTQQLSIMEQTENLLKFRNSNKHIIDTTDDLIAEESKSHAKSSETPEPEHISVEALHATLLTELKNLRTDVNNLKKNWTTGKVNTKANLNFDGRMHLKGQLRVKGSVTAKELTVLSINSVATAETFSSVLRADNFKEIKGQKTVTNLTVNELEFTQLNGIEGKDFAFKNDSIHLQGDIIFRNVVTVRENLLLPESGTVNGINLRDDIIQVNRTFQGPLEILSLNVLQKTTAKMLNEEPPPEHIKEYLERAMGIFDNGSIICKTFQVSGSLNAERVNGQNFAKLLRRMVFRNNPTHFPRPITINGDLILKNDAQVNFLNGLQFPGEYVLNGNSPSTSITGKKIFEGTLSTQAASVHGTLDDVDLNQVITLTGNEELTGNFSFQNIEVTESLDVKGAITGQGIPNFLPNPTISETHRIGSNVIFTNLQVDGEIIVQDRVNGSTWEEMLGDVVYKTDKDVVIKSKKCFNTSLMVNNNLHISSNTFNQQNISELLTKSTEQTINQASLNGIMIFDNLEVDGLYDDVNITELALTAITLDGDQDCTSEIIFEHDDALPDIVAPQLDITDSLNEIPYKDFAYRREPNTDDLLINDFVVENLTVTGNVYAPSRDFLLQPADVLTTFDTASVRDLYVGTINGIPADELRGMVERSKDVLKIVTEGSVFIKEIIVNGSVTTKGVNGHDLKSINANAIWLNKLNTDLKSVEFLDDISVTNLHVKSWNERDFETCMKDVVLRTENNMYVTGVKTFTGGLSIVENMNTAQINDVLVENFLTKSGDQTVQSPVHIIGDVHITNNLDVGQNLNGMVIDELKEIYREDENGYIHLAGDYQFVGVGRMEKLSVDQYTNGVQLKSFIADMVHKEGHMSIKGVQTFTNTVNFNGNIVVFGDYNGLNVPDMLGNILVHNTMQYVNYPVTFAGDVHVNNCVNVGGNLDAELVNGCNLTEWKTNSISLQDSVTIKGQMRFAEVTSLGGINVSYLNGKDMNKLIPLHTEQYINSTVTFLQIASLSPNVPVGNRVNNMILEDELKKTVMMDTYQTIKSPLRFHQPITVHENLITTGLVNDLNLQKIVTTDTDQDLHAMYTFKKKVTMDKEMDVQFLKGVDIIKMATKGVRLRGNETQVLTGDWVVDGKVTFNQNVLGSGKIGDFSLNSYMAEKRVFLDVRKLAHIAYQEDYSNVCSNVQRLIDNAKHQLCMFQYWENDQLMLQDHDVNSVYHFQSDSKHYLLVSYTGICSGSIYEWSPHYGRFNAHFSFEVGPVEQWITIKNGVRNYIVTRSPATTASMACEHFGVNVWAMDDEHLTHQRKMPDAIKLHQSARDGVFYALQHDRVVEYSIRHLHKRSGEHTSFNTRNWTVSGESLAFVNPQVGMGLSLTDGKNVYQLSLKEANRTFYPDPRYEQLIDDAVPERNVSMVHNHYLPKSEPEDVVTLTVGRTAHRRKLVAVASHEKMSVRGKLDFIKIYEDIIEGTLFHKIATYKPSYLNAIEFDDSGETFLVFLEDNKRVQVYQYKGIDGFKYHSTASLPGSKLYNLELPMDDLELKQKYLVLVDHNSVHLLKAIVIGGSFNSDDVTCSVK